MTTNALGKISFLDTPDVNGVDVLLNAGGIPTISSGTTAARPPAAIVGRLYLDTTTNRFYRDNGTSWDDLTQVLLLDGTTDQINVVDGTNVTPSVVSIADNPIIPGTERIRLPVGTTAQRPNSPAAGDTRFNTTISKAEVFNGTYWQSCGCVLQIVTGSIPTTSTTTIVPLDNTIPTNTEGSQIWSTSFTPVSATSTIQVSYSTTVSNNTASRSVITSVFAGTTNLGAVALYLPTSNQPYLLTNMVTYTPGSTATITLSARTGPSAAVTCYINQTPTATLGGALVSKYVIMEFE
jgi:hypothetical protein